MIKDEFPPDFKVDEKQIAIDFDGVIHNNNKGWYDGTCYGEPFAGAIEGIKHLSKEYTIIIFTAKVKDDRPLVDGKTGMELVQEWCDKYDISKYITEITAEKQRNFKSKHKYDLSKFGLTEQQIKDDCQIIYDTFLNANDKN